MKLLVVTPWPLGSPGGGQRLAKALAEALAADRAFEVIVAAGSGLLESAPPAEAGGPVREIRLRLVCARGVDTAYLDGLDTLVRETRPDLILYTPHYSSCGEQTAALAARLGIPLALCPAIHLDHRHHTSRAARRFYRAAAIVLALSDIERAWLVDRAGLRPEQVLTLGFRCRAPAAARPRGRGVEEAIRLLTVGGFARHKRIDDQIEAVAILRDVHHVDARLTVAGARREPRVLDDLRRLARRRGLDGQVAFLPDCADEELSRLYGESDAFLFTSRSESFGLAVWDAIRFGTFPVVYPHPVYRTLVQSSGYGVVARRSSPRALADAVAQALRRPLMS